MFGFNFIVINSRNDSYCIITDCKEGEDFNAITYKPPPKKIEPEENLHRNLIPGDGHCIANCFAEHLEEYIDKFLEKLYREFCINLPKFRQFFLMQYQEHYSRIS